MIEILLILSLIFLLIWGGLAINDNASMSGTFLYYIVLGVFIGSCICCKVNIPSAMDVYQGKTILKKTYKGEVPVDSTVIYKESKQ